MSRRSAPIETPDDLPAVVLHCLKQAGKPLALDAILRILHLPRKAKHDVQAALRALEAQGSAVRTGTGHAFAGRLKSVEGVVSVQRSGSVFLTRVNGARDVYLHPANLGDARHGDTVRALILPGRTGPLAEGRVVEVLHRGMVEVPVTPVRRQADGLWVCTPTSPRIQTLFVVDVSALPAPPQTGGTLLVRPGETLGPGLCAALATADLGTEESPDAQERLSKSLHAAPGVFPADALAQAGELPESPTEADFAGREDLRALPFVTIDGADAKDFDDAIYVEETPAGFRLLTAIADVAHYVPENSPLDREALRRGNSWYFPRSVEPMLPQALSNGLCSLKPDVPRLVMAAELHISRTGAVGRTAFYPAVIRSAARLTYDQVRDGLLLDTPKPDALPQAVIPMLRLALQAARLLAELRGRRGALDFDLPEAEFFFDAQGDIERVQARERHWGHRLIEEFMIAANEAVARFLRGKSLPFPYRLHPAPDPEKLETLTAYLANVGLTEQPERGKGPQGKELRGGRSKRPRPTPVVDVRAALRAAAGTPREYIINRLVLRAMMQARYSPEAEGHFGLASDCYCHFTSPIRRYADLMVHRALKHGLGLPGSPPPPSFVRQERICEDLNACERAAVEAERDIHKRLSILFLRDRVGEELDGVVSSVAEFGLFVELPEVLCEGMIRLGFLTDDYYEYLSERQELRGTRTRRIFRPGMPLRVRLLEASLARLEIDLAPADANIDPAALPDAGAPFVPLRPLQRPPSLGKATAGPRRPKGGAKPHPRGERPGHSRKKNADPRKKTPRGRR